MKRTPLFATLVLLFSLVTGFAYAQEAAININTADVATSPALTALARARRKPSLPIAKPTVRLRLPQTWRT